MPRCAWCRCALVGTWILHTRVVRESEWTSLITPVLPEDQDWHVQGRGLAYRAPVGRFLFGVLAEASAAKGRRYIWRLAMPLFEPSDVVVLTYSERIGGGFSSFSVEDQTALAGAVSEAVRTLPSEEAEMDRLADLTPGPNIRMSETAAYANTYLGNVERAAAILQAAKATTDDREWVREIGDRLQRFERLLHEDGRARAVEYLDAQAADTAEALKLIHA